METLRKEFWKHVSTVGGPADINDVFLKWAADNKLNYKTTNLLWSNIDKEIHIAFGKKEADISISGPEEEIAQLMNKDTPIDEGEQVGPLSEKKKNLIDTLTEEGEDNEEEEIETPNEIPPLGGEAPPTTPAPTTPIGAGGPPIGNPALV